MFSYMFKYGKRAGWMGIALVVLSILPVAIALIALPQMGDTVAMKVSASGEVLREGSPLQLLFAPAICFLLGLATFASARRQADMVHDSHVIAASTAERYLRNGIVTTVVLNGVNIYMILTALS